MKAAGAPPQRSRQESVDSAADGARPWPAGPWPEEPFPGPPPAGQTWSDATPAAGDGEAIGPDRLRAALRRTLAGTTARGAPFAVLGVLLVILVVGDTAAPSLLAAWTVVMLLLAALRTGCAVLALRRDQTVSRWFEPLAAVLGCLTGLGWGGVPYLFPLPTTSTELVALTIIGCAVIVTGALTNAPSRLTLAAYCLPVVLAQVAFNLEQSLLSQYWLGGAVGAFFLFAWVMSDRYRTEILRRLRSQDAERAVMRRLERQAAETAALAERYREEAERAGAASRAKSLFLANVSHEIRTPLNGVLGMAAALSQTALDERQRQMLGIIEQSGTELLRLIDDILDLSRIEAGKVAIAARPFDLAGLLRGVVAGHAEEARRKGLALRLEIPEGQEGRYLADPMRLRQVLQNLLSNAIKFTPSGWVALRVRALPGQDGAEPRLAFEVEDSGIGIPAAKQASIFDAFEQADASSTRRHGGTGLGLAICRQLVAMMGGSIAVESRPGAGALFRFDIVAPPAPEEPAQPAESGALPALQVRGRDGAMRPARVLAAEDSATNQAVLRALLAPGGVVLAIAADGEELLAAWEEGWAGDGSGAADVILMDVHMPVRDGLDATRELRRREAATGRPRTPVIALTANMMAHQLAEYREAGMDGTVAKPVERGALLAALAAALEARRAPAEAGEGSATRAAAGG